MSASSPPSGIGKKGSVLLPERNLAHYRTLGVRGPSHLYLRTPGVFNSEPSRIGV